jgi:molecular chaperone GrpE
MSETDQSETNTTDASAPGAEASPADPLTAAQKEAAASQDRYLRAVADMENLRKRTVREKEEARQFASTNVMQDLIPVLDNLGLGLAAARQQTDVKAVADGVNLVLEQLKSALARNGLKEVNPAGQVFDHNLHECIAHQPDAKVPEETVIQVVRSGYTLNGRLLRPASVIVSSGLAKAGEAKN